MPRYASKAWNYESLSMYNGSFYDLINIFMAVYFYYSFFRIPTHSLRALLLLWAAHHQHQNASTTGGTHLFTIPTHLSPATAPPRSILRESTIHHIYLLHKVLGTDNGNILALPSGAGFGTTTSHRAEARGMLSGTVFMQRPPFFLHKQEQTSQLKHTCYSDNMGLIT